jgi:hypothetical protein
MLSGHEAFVAAIILPQNNLARLEGDYV